MPITLTVGQCYNNFTSQWFLAYSNPCSIINSFNQTFFPGLWAVLVSIYCQPDIAYRNLRVKPYLENHLDQTDRWASLLSVEDCPDWYRRAQPTISSTILRQIGSQLSMSLWASQRTSHCSGSSMIPVQPSVFLNDGLWLGNVRQIMLSYPPQVAFVRVFYYSTEKKQKYGLWNQLLPPILNKAKKDGERKEGPMTKGRRKERKTKRQYE